MDLWHGLLLITSFHLLAAISPGPDFVLVSQQTLSNGKRTGLLCSFGITLGLSVHIIYSSFGLAAIIANSSTALWVIKILGGSYLLYLGYKGIRAKPAPDEDILKQTAPRYSAKKSIGVGFLCNALNPKAPVYFMALFTMVISPDMPLYQLAIYGVWMMIIQMAWFSTVVMLLSTPSINRRFKRSGHWLDRVLGSAMMLMGLKIITSRIN
jgi:RhtB (resistance to homoserine/threonine) family protein